MEKYCLAEYVAYFNVHFPKSEDGYKRKTDSEAMSFELPEDNYDLDTVDDPDGNGINEEKLTILQ